MNEGNDVILFTPLEETAMNQLFESVGDIESIYETDLCIESGIMELTESIVDSAKGKLKGAWEKIKALLSNLFEKINQTLRRQVQQLNVEVTTNSSGEKVALFRSKLVKQIMKITFDKDESYRFIRCDNLLRYLKSVAKELVKGAQVKKITGAGSFEKSDSEDQLEKEGANDGGLLSTLSQTVKGGSSDVDSLCRNISSNYQKCVMIIYSDICSKAVKKQGNSTPRKDILKKWKSVTGLAIKATNFTNLVKKVSE